LRKAKSFNISPYRVIDAWKLVKENGGGAGVDGKTIEDVEKDMKNQLYKLWNRMSSGSYLPPPVKLVEIPKKNGGIRPLGIPTVLDRVAQMVVKLELEPKLDPLFHEDSYGYRPRKSAHDALGKAQERCYRKGWVIDLDIKGFFDSIDHEMMMKAVKWHKPEDWIVLYLKRWLKAPMQNGEDIQKRDRGTPQGGVVSPLLANLYLHYAFDKWMTRKYPNVPFERYADDIVIHCDTKEEAERVRTAIDNRLKECKLTVHPEKTKTVFCRRSRRRGSHKGTSFDFLGYTFRPRVVKNREGRIFVGYVPAISMKAQRHIHDEIRSWKLHLKSSLEIEDISHIFNPKLRGWYQYYGRFRKSAFYRTFAMFQNILLRWARKKYKRLKKSWVRAAELLKRMAEQKPNLFIHWSNGWIKNGWMIRAV
jgi:RNA-directed DNA polymerase